MGTVLREAFAIVCIASVLALVYNAFNPQGISLLRKQQRLQMIEDTVLQRELQELGASDVSRVGATSAAGTLMDGRKDGRTQSPTVDGSPQEALAKRQKPLQETTSSPAKPAPSLEESAPRAVRYEQVLQLLQHPDVLIVDARRPEDYAAGHIPGARNIFPYDFAAHIPELVVLPRTKPILIYCDGGQCELSHQVAEQLRNLGFQRLYIYEGGWEEWRRRHGD
ncbi:MAG: rhodanese-like domain-containing protein [Candidatus Kapabacteria bacterium]|nr:rhodanese-like domain-containing protein [Candidatus Kapabacteria bacterium]MCS7170269.1 rhodanese-like domain-containing protein [Candidatus Kapabacteria bacterium]MDW7997390.1 rhodanese-like domain-containing protein [Bacteroidota bacterium]MDW8224560.1 rhodanese-like domain-containing protein [Bacteroidota bacterium]